MCVDISIKLAKNKIKMLHLKSPLILSSVMSRILDRPVYLKLDNLQPPGSFKIRGIGKTCSEAKINGFQKLVGSSGGNAGLAMAYAANQLDIPLTLFIPKVIFEQQFVYFFNNLGTVGPRIAGTQVEQFHYNETNFLVQ